MADQNNPDWAPLHKWVSQRCEEWQRRADADFCRPDFSAGGARMALAFATYLHEYVRGGDMDEEAAKTVLGIVEAAAESAYVLAGHPLNHEKEKFDAAAMAFGIPLALSLAAIYGRASALILKGSPEHV